MEFLCNLMVMEHYRLEQFELDHTVAAAAANAAAAAAATAKASRP